MEDIGILEESFTDGFVSIVQVSMNAQTDNPFPVESEVLISHIRELTGDDQRPDDEKDGQRKLENNQDFSKKWI